MSLGAYVARRVLWTVPLVLGVMLVTFALMRGAGGDPFEPPEGFGGLPESEARKLRAHYRLEEPWLVEFAYWVKNVFAFEFGPSLLVRDLDVADVVRNALPVTGTLVLLAAAWSVPAGIALGVWAAGHRNRIQDLLASSLAAVLLVVPVFFLVFVLRKYFVLEWRVVSDGWEPTSARVLPVLALGLAPAGYVARLVRTALVDALEEDYVRTARAKGLRRSRILWVHALRNALAPLLSAAIPMIALLITGAFFVEQAFRIPGISSFFVTAAQARDYPMIMNLTVALAVVVLVANLVADVLLALVDPRILEGERR